MSNVNIEILFQSKTFNIIVNKEGNSKEIFNKFIEQLKNELNIKENNIIFKLLTINTKEMYLVNEDNFSTILNEKTQEEKIKLFLELGDEKENKIEPLEEDMLGGIKKIIDEGDDFNDKLSLSGSNEITNNIIDKKDESIINDKKDLDEKNKEDKLNNIKNENNIINENNKNINNNDNNINTLINNKNNENYIKNNDDDKNQIDIENNKIENKNNQNNQINQVENNNNLIEIIELCTLCKKVIKDKIKYECCLCDKCVLCQNCEKEHEHPCIKFKIGKSFLLNLSDCHSFISQKHNFTNIIPIKYIKNIFNDTYDIILQLGIDNHIEIRPNKTIEIPLLIKNYSDKPISTNDFILIIRNFSIVNITYEIQDKLIIQPKNYIQTNLKCISKENTGRDIINVEIYSTTIKIRESKFSNIKIELLVSTDEEDEELNKKFIFYPKMQLLNKLRKKMLLYIFDNHFCDNSLTQIYECLCENNWNLDTAINQLNNQI